MASVTERIKQIRQIVKIGRYITMSEFDKHTYSDGMTLHADENVHSSLIGSAVEYLTRFHFLGRQGKSSTEIFNVPFQGAYMAEYYYGQKGAVEVFKKLLNEMFSSPMTRESLFVNALKIATFDVWYRNPSNAVSNAYELVNPDSATIDNVHVMLKRSVSFFEECGGVTACGFNFAPSGYTKTVHSGDGDFLTADTLWDMKVLRGTPKSEAALQVLMYYIMGQHSGQEIFKSVTKLGIYNPRQNTAYTLDTAKISPEVIREIEEKVICY